MRSSHHHHRRGGFTLIELLVTIGIIALLAGLALPLLMKSYGQAGITRTKADLQLIATALEAYKGDFGGAYPVLDDDNTSGGFNAMPSVNRGAILLCKAMLGPGSQSTTTTPTLPNLGDGATGPGFRTRPGGAGKIYGPYVDGDKFKIGGTDKINFTDAVLLDRSGNPILYYPANIQGRATSTAGSFVTTFASTDVGTKIRPVYNANDNLIGFPAANVQQLQVLLGADNAGGVGGTPITPGLNRNPSYTGPYLLWTAGPDGAFGLDASGKSDDICNFDLPGDLRK